MPTKGQFSPSGKGQNTSRNTEEQREPADLWLNPKIVLRTANGTERVLELSRRGLPITKAKPDASGKFSEADTIRNRVIDLLLAAEGDLSQCKGFEIVMTFKPANPTLDAADGEDLLTSLGLGLDKDAPKDDGNF